MIEYTVRGQIVQRLLSVSVSGLTEAAIQDTTSLREDLGIGSLDLISLAADLEQELGIRIDDDVLAGIGTIGDLFEAIDNAKRQDSPA